MRDRTGPGPVAHPASCYFAFDRMTCSPPPSVTVMIRPAGDEITTRDGRPILYVYEPGLIARLLGVILETVNHAYGVRLLRI